MIEHAFHFAINLFAIDEGHFHIELRKFGLAVGTEVFVAETAGDLVVLVETRDHRQLFEYLWRLRQGEELTRVDARGHNKIACSFGRRFEQYRRFDLDKPAVVEVFADLRYGLCPHADVVLELRTAKVEIAVFEPRVFGRQVFASRDLKLKRRNLCVVQYQDFG